jgi:hypothetical protein
MVRGNRFSYTKDMHPDVDITTGNAVSKTCTYLTSIYSQELS